MQRHAKQNAKKEFNNQGGALKDKPPEINLVWVALKP